MDPITVDEAKPLLRGLQQEGYTWINNLGDLIQQGKLVEAGDTKNLGFAIFDRLGEIQNMLICPGDSATPVEDKPLAVLDIVTMMAGAGYKFFPMKNDLVNPVTNSPLDPASLTVGIPSLLGNAVVNFGDGTFGWTVPGGTPDQTVTIPYTLFDENGDSCAGEYQIVVDSDCVQPVTNNDGITVQQGGTGQINLFDNDSNVDPDSLVFFEADYTGIHVDLGNGGSADYLGNGVLEITAGNMPVGSQTFIYRVTSAEGCLGEWTTVTVTVQGTAAGRIQVNEACYTALPLNGAGTDGISGPDSKEDFYANEIPNGLPIVNASNSSQVLAAINAGGAKIINVTGNLGAFTIPFLAGGVGPLPQQQIWVRADVPLSRTITGRITNLGRYINFVGFNTGVRQYEKGQYNGWGCNRITGGGGFWTKNLTAGEPDCVDAKIWNNEFSGMNSGVMLAIHSADGYANTRRTLRPWFHKNYVHDITSNGGLEVFNMNGRSPWLLPAANTYGAVTFNHFANCTQDPGEIFSLKCPGWALVSNRLDPSNDATKSVMNPRYTSNLYQYDNYQQGLGLGPGTRHHGGGDSDDAGIHTRFNIYENLRDGFFVTCNDGPWTAVAQLDYYYLQSKLGSFSQNALIDVDNLINMDWPTFGSCQAMPAGNIVRENLLFNKSAVSIKDDTAGNSVTEAGWNANNPGDLRNDQILLPNDEGGGCFSPNGSEEIDLSPITFAGVWDAAHRWNGSSDIIMEPGPYWNSLIGIT